MLEAHHHEETEMPRSTAIQSERARRCSPRASTSPASFNRHSPDSRPVGPDFPSLDVPPQRNSIAIAAAKRPEILTSSACALKMSKNPDPAPATNYAILSRKFN
jgi:hypothetical protein